MVLAYALYALGVLVVLTGCQFGLEPGGWDDSLATALPAMALFALGQGAAQEARAGRQGEYEDRARAILDGIGAGRPVPPFGLYLRPFFTSGAAQVRTFFGMPHFLRPASVLHPDRSAFDEAVQQGSGIALLKIGSALDRLGAGALRVRDEEWQEVFSKLVDRASFIVAIPIASPATAWEIAEIFRRKAHPKTVFYVPAALDAGSLLSRRDMPTPEQLDSFWRYSRQIFARSGASMPAVPLGSAFLAGPGEAEWWAAPFESKRSQQAVWRHLAELTAPGGERPAGPRLQQLGFQPVPARMQEAAPLGACEASLVARQLAGLSGKVATTLKLAAEAEAREQAIRRCLGGWRGI